MQFRQTVIYCGVRFQLATLIAPQAGSVCHLSDSGFHFPISGFDQMSKIRAIASLEYQGQVTEVLEFLKRTRSELRMLRMVHVYRDRLHVIDINGDAFEITNIGYPDADIVPILNNVNTAYKAELIHQETKDEYKQFKTGRRYCWAQDRVM